MPESGREQTAIQRGASTNRAVRKLAAHTAGETTFLTTDQWLTAIREVDEVLVEFCPADSLGDAHIWWDGDAFRASGLGAGLEHLEGTPLDRNEAGALLDGGTLMSAVGKEEFTNV